MKYNAILILGLMLAPIFANAVSIRNFETKRGPIRLVELDEMTSGLEFVATIKQSGKKVSCRVRSLTYRGRFEGINCGALTNKCSATFLYTSDQQVVAEIYGDLGNPQGSEFLGELILGAIDDKDQVSLNSQFQFQSQFVQERFNFAEKMIGAKDRDYCAIQFE